MFRTTGCLWAGLAAGESRNDSLQTGPKRNVAMDAARAALPLGAQIHIVYRRSQRLDGFPGQVFLQGRCGNWSGNRNPCHGGVTCCCKRNS